MTHLLFSHGQDGEPWGTKIVAMAEVARRHGLEIDSIDYRGMADPLMRVEALHKACGKLHGPLLLAGSSMGGHVAAAVSSCTPTLGMFLLAPAFFMPGYEQHTPAPPACRIEIVHGWNDDVVPVENSIRWARQYRATLHILDSDHRLTANLEEICEIFDRFLASVLRSRQ